VISVKFDKNNLEKIFSKEKRFLVNVLSVSLTLEFYSQLVFAGRHIVVLIFSELWPKFLLQILAFPLKSGSRK